MELNEDLEYNLEEEDGCLTEDSLKKLTEATLAVIKGTPKVYPEWNWICGWDEIEQKGENK